MSNLNIALNVGGYHKIINLILTYLLFFIEFCI